MEMQFVITDVTNVTEFIEHFDKFMTDEGCTENSTDANRCDKIILMITNVTDGH